MTIHLHHAGGPLSAQAQAELARGAREAQREFRAQLDRLQPGQRLQLGQASGLRLVETRAPAQERQA